MRRPLALIPLMVLALLPLTDARGDGPQTLNDLDRGHRLILQGGYQIHARIRNAENLAAAGLDFDTFAQSNYTGIKAFTPRVPEEDLPKLLGPADSSDLIWSRSEGSWDLSLQDKELPWADNLFALQLRDEQDISDPQELETARLFMNNLRQRLPNVIGFTNQAGGESAEDVRHYMQYARPDMLFFGIYPWRKGPTLTGGTPQPTGGSPTSLYRKMKEYRDLAMEGHELSNGHAIPYGLYFQTFDQDDRLTESTWRGPSVSELRLTQFAPLAFGFRYQIGWHYERVADPDSADDLKSVLFDGPLDQNPTATFHQLAESNKNVRNIGQAIVRLINTDVRMITGPNSDPNHNVPAWAPGADPYTQSITVTNLSDANDGEPGDLIVGYFTPLLEPWGRDEEIYFMIVNGLTDPEANHIGTQQQIVMEFDFADSGIDTLEWVSRASGSVIEVPLDHLGGSRYRLEWTLPGGTGDLFRFKTDLPFVTLVPEPGTAAGVLLLSILLTVRSPRRRRPLERRVDRSRRSA